MVKNGQAVVSSRQVAGKFNRLHKHVLENIRQILVAENSATKFFQETNRIYRGQSYPEYLMNRDGFTLLAMGFTGKEALQWKLKYITAFNEMEAKLKQLPKQQTLIEEPYNPTLKYYRGIPVVTKKDLAALLNTFPALIQQYMNREGTLIREKDYFVLSGLELQAFDKTNPCTVRPSTTALTVIAESGVRKICRDRKRSTVCKDIFGVARRAVVSLPNAVAGDDVEVPASLIAFVKALRKQVIALDCITKIFLNASKRPQKEIDGYRAVIVDCYGEMITDIAAIRSFK